MSGYNSHTLKKLFGESFYSFLQKTSPFKTAQSELSFMSPVKPSSFFSSRCNINIKSYFVTPARLNSYTQCKRQLTSLRQGVSKFLLARHFHSIAAQRIRRANQIFLLYGNLGYDCRYIRTIFDKWFQNISKTNLKNTWSFLLGSAIFVWKDDQVSDSELEQVSNEFDIIRDLKSKSNLEWEEIVSKKDVKVWRKPMQSSDLYQYKVCGSYKDVSARAFFNTQVDLEFRRQWDNHVISLDVIDKDESSGSEVVHWITQFPYPMSSREYVYVRRHKVDTDKKLMVIISRGVDNHPSVPPNSEHIRVVDYSSKMVIRSHGSFDENGFDYVLTYFDDPKSSIPKVAQSWVANSGIPDFVDKLHDAALLLQNQKRRLNASETSCKNDSLESDQDSDFNETKVPM